MRDKSKDGEARGEREHRKEIECVGLCYSCRLFLPTCSVLPPSPPYCSGLGLVRVLLGYGCVASMLVRVRAKGRGVGVDSVVGV
jgi:hypothetical protein